MTESGAPPGRAIVRLGLAAERQIGFSAELVSGVEAVAREWGWSHRRVDDAGDELASDVVLAIGDVRLFPDLVLRPKSTRRVLWHGETLPRPTAESGSRVHSLVPTGRLLDVAARVVPRFARLEPFARWREHAAIVREPIANLAQLRRARSAFDRIVVDSHDRAEGALRAGLPVDVVPYGYHERFAGPLRTGGERPIDVLLLAHLVGLRRRRLLATVGARLAEHGIALERITAGIYGEQRTEMLRRTRIVIDLHRLPGNSPGFRFIVATAGGAALVTEPLASSQPLVAGEHYVEAPAQEMAEAVRALLADEPRRLRLVEAGQRLLATDLHMRQVLPRVLKLRDP